MQSDKIRRILKENKDIFETLENYDKTRELPFQRKRIDITLSVNAINKLKTLKQKTGKPASRIIEEFIESSPIRPLSKPHKPDNLKEEPVSAAEIISSYIG